MSIKTRIFREFILYQDKTATFLFDDSKCFQVLGNPDIYLVTEVSYSAITLDKEVFSTEERQLSTLASLFRNYIKAGYTDGHLIQKQKEIESLKKQVASFAATQPLQMVQEPVQVKKTKGASLLNPRVKKVKSKEIVFGED